MPDLIDSVSADKVRRATVSLIGILHDYQGRADSDLAYIRVGDVRKIIRALCEVGIARAVTREEAAALVR